MFLSYEYAGAVPYDPKTGEYRWRYKIVDSEWEAVGVGVAVGIVVGVAVAVMVAVAVGVAVGVAVAVGV